MIARVQERYKKEIVPAMMEKFSIKNSMAVPRLVKIVINMGVGKTIIDKKVIEYAEKDLSIITGQKPIVTKAKVAVSNFKLREGMPIGLKVTLRRSKMYEFLDRFVSIALPRIRDFNGVSRKSFDNQGNYSLGLIDQAIFPEIDTGKLQHSQGMDITFVFNKGPKEQTQELLEHFGMPFTKQRNSD